ncbi:MAG TPA: glycosyltransferase [Elusimicrobiota bacterium]|nr:glycosyltransferase [Elusimicrobiota bacterium]
MNSFVKDSYRPGMKIVDFGAGSCCWNTESLPVYGIDLNENLLAHGKERGRLAGYHVGDIVQSDLPAQSSDIVVAAEVLEHIVDVDAAVAQAHRLLKDGGVFIVSVPHDTALSAWRLLFAFHRVFQGIVLRNDYYRHQCGHVHRFSMEAIRNLLVSRGFSIRIAFSLKTFSLFLVAVKNGGKEDPRSFGDLTVIIPTLNEEGTIAAVLRDVTQSYRDIKVIVSDGGSHDRTVEIVREQGRQNPAISLRQRGDHEVRGLTASVLGAIADVKTNYFIVMDGDGQHPARGVSYLYNHLLLGTPVCVGVRAAVTGRSWGRKTITAIGSILGKTGLWLRRKNVPGDVLSGFWGVETEVWRKICRGRDSGFRPKGYKILYDFLKLCDMSVKTEDVFYVFLTRGAGTSKANLRVYWEYVRSLLC